MSGELLIILAQLTFAVGFLFTKKLTQDTSSFLVTALVILIAAIVLSPILIYFHKELKLFSSQKLLWAILAGILWIALGEIFLITGLSKVGISVGSLLFLTFPLFAITLGIIFLGETITSKFIIGSSLMIAGYIAIVV